VSKQRCKLTNRDMGVEPQLQAHFVLSKHISWQHIYSHSRAMRMTVECVLQAENMVKDKSNLIQLLVLSHS